MAGGGSPRLVSDMGLLNKYTPYNHGMNKLKVMTVVGTRPEIIRLSRVLARLDQYCDHVLVHTGQNYDYELNQVFFDDLGVRKPDHFLDSAAHGGGAAQTRGNLITAVDRPCWCWAIPTAACP